MSRITELLRRLEKENPGLAADLRNEVAVLSHRRAFGLNFERHVPETVELPHRKVRRGDKVRFLAPRGESAKKVDRRLWLVARVSGKGNKRSASLIEWSASDTPEETARLVDDLVVVAEFRDPIYPGLRSTGLVERGGDKPYHLVINGENYHALDALLFAYEAKVDCIYIDPPYNTRDKDWKYNNDYVDSDDAYRHSKWLAMMERRLKLAKKLLKPHNSVLIVTIDEKEYLRLGLLLEQTFPSARIQMVSSVMNPKGATRASAFARTDEYLFFVMFGDAVPTALPLSTEWKVSQDPRASKLRWAELLRAGSNTQRADSPNQFYPVFVRNTEGGPVFDSVGETFHGTDRSEVEPPDGCVAVWPIRSDGSEGNWQISAKGLRSLIDRGYARLGGWRGEETAISYLKRGEQRKVDDGTFPVIDRRQDGSVLTDPSDYTPTFVPGTQWRLASHNAEQGGTNLLKQLIPSRKFPYPKSLYAVEDALRFFVVNQPEAVILDFFAGSGTTGHAVMRLNRQDGGRRQSILVTNNEVSAKEGKGLRKRNLRPGDEEWEALGICEYITKPRLLAATTGQTPEGKPVSGNYRFTDGFAMSEGLEENVEFFELTYEDPEQVRLDLAFAAVAPLLWIRAGSEGRRIDARSDLYDMTHTYGILFNVDAASGFLKESKKRPELRVAYVVTDEEKQYQLVAGELPPEVETVQLYEAYVTTFEINSARDSR